MSAVASYAAALPVPSFPAGVDVHWETEHRMVWNEQQHTSEERELVFEISWIAELGCLAALSAVAAEGKELKTSCQLLRAHFQIRFVSL